LVSARHRPSLLSPSLLVVFDDAAPPAVSPLSPRRSSDLHGAGGPVPGGPGQGQKRGGLYLRCPGPDQPEDGGGPGVLSHAFGRPDRKSTRLNSSHVSISYAVCCLKKKKDTEMLTPHRKRR